MNKTYIKFLSAAVITTMIMPMTAAYAMGRDHKVTPVNLVKPVSSMVQNKENESHGQGVAATIKANIAQLRQELMANKTTMLANIRTIHQLKMQVIQKKQTINSLVEYLLNNQNAITSDELSQIDAQNAVIKADIQAINSTQGTVEQEDNNIVQDVKKKDIQGVAQGITNVIAKQQQRINGLTKLSTDLDSMISTLQSVKEAVAAAVSTAAQTGTTTTAADTTSVSGTTGTTTATGTTATTTDSQTSTQTTDQTTTTATGN